MKTPFLTVFASVAILAGSLPLVHAVDVPRWQPHDFSFSAAVDSPNPFMVEIAAKVTAPDGRSFALPGFFDGNGTWKIRVSPNTEGRWSLVTKSAAKQLDGKTVEFTCVENKNPNCHGVLHVDKAHPYHFIFEDGTRFFMQGYEYDWLWALDMDQPGVPTVEASLDLLAKHGFNYVILNSYAHDTVWRMGTTGPDDFGPSLMYPWEGTNEQPVHSRPHLEFWQHYDQVIDALAARGMQAHILLKVYNKQVNWPDHDSDEERLFFRWLVARYAAYPNVIWDFAKEAHNEKDVAYKQRWMEWIRENDPYHHLTTIHDDDKANDLGAYDAVTDFRADQHHGNDDEVANGQVKGNSNRTGSNRDTIAAQRARRAWPVANVESDYEHGPGGLDDKTYTKTHTPEVMISTAWDIQMAGGYNAYYYTYTAWDIVRPLDEPPGYGLYKHFGDFWRSTQYWALEPANQLVSQGKCQANPGREYVVYQIQPTTFTLEIAEAHQPLKAEWFHPHTGKRYDAGQYGNGTASLTPPTDWGNAPLVLHLSTVP